MSSCRIEQRKIFTDKLDFSCELLFTKESWNASWRSPDRSSNRIPKGDLWWGHSITIRFLKGYASQTSSRIFIQTTCICTRFSKPKGDGVSWRAFDTIGNTRKTFANTNGWRPRNNGGKYSQYSTLAKGLTLSENIATASLLEAVGGQKEPHSFCR